MGGRAESVRPCGSAGDCRGQSVTLVDMDDFTEDESDAGCMYYRQILMYDERVGK